MKIFITGATGFIGSHLVRRLAHSPHELRCLVRHSSDVHALKDGGVELVWGDVCEPATLIEGMRGCDWVFNLAGLYAMWTSHPADFARVNVEGTRNVMQCALEAGVSKVVHVSTVAIYGNVPGRITEDTPPGAVHLSAYGRTKFLGEQAAWELYRSRGLPLVTLYPGIVLGAGDDKASGQYIRDFVRGRTPSTIFTHSTSTYVFVEDVVEAILCAAEKPGNVGQKYLVGKYQLDGREYARLISKVSGTPMPWFDFPDFMVMAVAGLLTGLANLTNLAPLWGLSVDAGRTLKAGFRMDGGKAERELGIHYTPIQTAVAEAVEFYRRKGQT